MKDARVDDHPLSAASGIVQHALAGGPRPAVKTFFDEETFTATHVVYDAQCHEAAIIDSVLDYDAAAGRTSEKGAQQIVDFVNAEGLHVTWQLETHAHADHLSAAPWLKEKLGGRLVIGAGIVAVQNVFGKIFNADTRFPRDGSQFDQLLEDGARFRLGAIEGIALHVPGHTPADMAYVIGDAVFVGDTLFMPDYGTARADFPGGDARQLYRSIRRLLSLPPETRVFLCHDYKTPERDAFVWQTTIGEQRANNIHVRDGMGEEAFVRMRQKRDAALGMPQLFMPSVQINMRAGHLPEAEDDGVSYIKIPINRL